MHFSIAACALSDHDQSVTITAPPLPIAELPIIIATGYDQAHLDERARIHPLTAVLNKPYDIAQLQAAIDKIASSA